MFEVTRFIIRLYATFGNNWQTVNLLASNIIYLAPVWSTSDWKKQMMYLFLFGQDMNEPSNFASGYVGVGCVNNSINIPPYISPG